MKVLVREWLQMSKEERFRVLAAEVYRQQKTRKK